MRGVGVGGVARGGIQGGIQDGIQGCQHMHTHQTICTLFKRHALLNLPPLQDLRDLFRLDPAETQASATQRELHAMHAAQRKQSPELAAHLAFLATLDCYAGGQAELWA